ncbi:MAG: hypothetical protein E7164_02030 [Firmicutes bacterium]|nr:hypothetical protein [Bacillota bacterium]
MKQIISRQLLENPRLLSHFMEQSYWIKQLNRHLDSWKDFNKQMKILYKERSTDKINSAIDGIEMLSSLIDATK